MFYIYLNAWKLLSIPVVFNIHSKNAGNLPEFSSILRNADIRENLFSFLDNVLHFLKMRNINYNVVCLSDAGKEGCMHKRIGKIYLLGCQIMLEREGK